MMNQDNPPPSYNTMPNPDEYQQIRNVFVNPAPPNWGPHSMRINCPYCNTEVTTTLELAATSKTHLYALLLCIFGCYCCCCIPYCVDSCRGTKHFCPKCKTYLGVYSD